MKIVFMGTPDFAVPTLRRLLETGYHICAVVTQPDRPKGRGHKLVAPPVKLLAEAHHIPVLQPEKIRTSDVQQQLREIAPDLIVVAAYGQILPPSVLQIPPQGCINVHASLLPKYRGAAPINWAIIRGERETGITTMLMDAGMDTGDLLLQRAVPIADDDTVGTLHDKLSVVGAEVLIDTLQQLAQGTLTPIPQQHEAATYAPPLKKEDGLINWRDPAVRIYNKVRGLCPWPGAYTSFQGKTVKLLRVSVAHDVEYADTCVPGTVVLVNKGEGPVIATGDGYLRILEIQPENKKPMSCSDFCRGYHLAVSERLGY